MYPGTTRTKFGQKPAPLRELMEHPSPTLAPATLKVQRWVRPIPILDQEDLLKQGIHTSQFIPGCATDVDALGSCTANASTGSYAERLAAAYSGADIAAALAAAGLSPTDAAQDEEWAIKFYNATTDAYGGPGGEWPPNDDGSTGIYCCDELEAEHHIQSHVTGAGLEGLLTMLQIGSAIVGSPWFNSMMEPDQYGFIDGDGSRSAFEAMVRSGLAGGHERYAGCLETLALTRTGEVDILNTVLEDDNSWSESWGDQGRYRYHASFVVWLGGQFDSKQFVVS